MYCLRKFIDIICCFTKEIQIDRTAMTILKSK